MPHARTPLSDADFDRLCEMVHEALRAFGAVEDRKPLPRWTRAPKWMKDATRESIQAVLDDPTQKPGQQHITWMAKKKADGWTYGPKKDGRKKTHPMLVPFSKLSTHEQKKDAILIALVRAFIGA